MVQPGIAADTLLPLAQRIQPGFSPHTLNSWRRSGLSAAPVKGRGRKNYVPDGQDTLLTWLLRARRMDGKKVLDWQRALIVLFMFVMSGDEVVPVQQVMRAWSTWILDAFMARYAKNCNPSRRRDVSLSGVPKEFWQLHEALESSDRLPEIHRIRTSAHNLAARLVPEDTIFQAQLAQGFVRLFRDGDDTESAALMLQIPWVAEAEKRLPASSVRRMHQVYGWQEHAFAHADTFDERYWRWVGPFWCYVTVNQIPVGMLGFNTSLNDAVNNIGHNLLTLFGMALMIPPDDNTWQVVPQDLRPSGLYNAKVLMD